MSMECKVKPLVASSRICLAKSWCESPRLTATKFGMYIVIICSNMCAGYGEEERASSKNGREA